MSYHDRTSANRRLLCHLTKVQYDYLQRFAERHNISMSAALVRMLLITHALEHLPEADMQTDWELRQMGARDRQRAARQ